MKKFVSVLLCCLMAFSLVACGGAPAETPAESDIVIDPAAFAEFTGPTIDAIKEAGVLTMATEAQYAPFEFIDTKGNFVGCDIWLGKQIAAALGVELKITDMAFDGIVPAIKAGQANLGIAAITFTADRAEEVDFSTPYIESPQALVVAKGNEDVIKEIGDLAGKTVGAQRGTVQSELIKGVLTESNLFELDKWPNVAMEVASGKIDCLLVDAPAADNMIAGNDKLALANYTFSKDEMSAGEAVIMQKGNQDLVDLVNAVIEAVAGDKGFDAAYDAAAALSKEMGL